MGSSESSSKEQFPSYGAMSAVMRDHVYIPERNTRVYTSPCIVASVSTPFDVFVGITACGAEVTMETETGIVSGSALIVGARERRLTAQSVKLTVFQLDPFHSLYPVMRGHRGALKLDREAFRPFDAQLDAAYRGVLTLEEAQQLTRGVLAELSRQLPAVPTVDPRVINAMHALYENPRVTVEELAKASELSYDRMSHLFMDELGISIRSLQVWVKLHRALSGIRYGQSLIELAEIAGFSDAAHLSRVYKQVYGAPPSYFYYSGNVKLIASVAGEIPGNPNDALRKHPAVKRSS